MNKHTFAIIAYKESPYLQECIDSLKKQSSGSRIIVCTSTPNEFLRRTASENGLAFSINTGKRGIAEDWNFALGQAETGYVTLAHQDDIYHEDYAKEIVGAMEEYDDVIMAFSDYDELVHKKNGSVSRRRRSLNFAIKKLLNFLGFFFSGSIRKNKKRLLAFGNPIGCPTVTFHKTNIGDFRFDSAFSVNLDWDAWCRLSKEEGSFLWIKKTLVSHRIHEGSETSLGLQENRRQKEDLEIFGRIWPAPVAKILGKIYAISYNNNG